MKSFFLVIALAAFSVGFHSNLGSFEQHSKASKNVVDLLELGKISEVEALDLEEITPQSWQSISLRMNKADGSQVKIDLLRPLWWCKKYNVKVDGTIYLKMPEMGISGEAPVLNIGRCLADSRNLPEDQQIVIGKFSHENATIIDLYFDSEKKPIGTTLNHPFFSTIRNTWIAAKDLKKKELVETKSGVARLVEVKQREGKHQVYNLEVHRNHNYYVSNLKALAHNSCFNPPNTVKSAKGVDGTFSVRPYRYRIDTNKVAPGEGGFHIHIYKGKDEVAKITGRGGYVKTHSSKVLKKPSEMPKQVRKEIRKLVEHVKKHLK